MDASQTTTSKPRTFRLSNIPNHVTRDTLINYFLPEDRENVKVRSFCPEVEDDENDRENCLYTATVFHNPRDPTRLEPALTDPSIEIDKDFHGFTPLYVPREGTIEADIVAVTGLAGHAFGSWAHSPDRMWLRDYLPRDARNARIMTWGYPSSLRGDESTSILADFATNFFQRLIDMRDGARCEHRPIIFIGNSLGCLVIKKALTDVTSKGILNGSRLPVRAIIFLGAPHKGLSCNSHEILDTLVKGRITQQLVAELSNGSATLVDLGNRFNSLAQEIKILSVYETKESSTVIERDGRWVRDGRPMMMVPQSSAVLNCANETVVAAHMDHSQLAKVKKGENGIYPNIRSAIRQALLSTAKVYATNNQEPQLSDAPAAPTPQPEACETPSFLKPESGSERGSSPRPDACQELDTYVEPDQPVECYPNDNDLMRALKWADSETLSALCHNRSLVSMRGPDGYPPICVAARYGLKNGLCTLLAAGRGASLEARNRDGDNALIVAIKNKQLRIIETLLEHGASVDAVGGDGFPALHLAVLHNDSALRLLLDGGADPDSTDKFGWTGMMIAARYGDMGAGMILFQHHANVNYASESASKTALMLAAEEGHEDMCRELLEAGAEVNTCLQPEWDTALALAVKNEHFGTAELLLNYRAAINTANSSDYTPLMTAAEAGHIELVNLLLEHVDNGANVNANEYDSDEPDNESDDEKDNSGGSLRSDALVLAAAEGHADVCEALFQAGANINASLSPDGETPLTLAAQHGYDGVLEVLLSDAYYVPHKPTGASGLSPLMHASMHGHTDAVDVLLRNMQYENIDDRSADGNTALSYAAAAGHPNIARLLLEAGADVECETADGERPLGLAAKMGHIAVVNLLLPYGADSNPEVLGLRSWSELWCADHVTLPVRQKVVAILKGHEKVNRSSRRSLKFWK